MREETENDNSYKIRWLTADFVNKNIERQYLHSRRNNDKIHSVVVSLIIAFVWIFLILMDIVLVYPQYPEVGSQLLTLRVTGFFLCILLSLSIWKSSDLRYLGYMILVSLILASPIFSYCIVSYVKTVGISFNNMVYIGVVIMTVLAYPITVTHATFFVVIVQTNALVTHKFFLGSTPESIGVLLSFMTIAAVIALFLSNSLNRVRRSEYGHKCLLEQSNLDLVSEINLHKSTQQRLKENQHFLDLDVHKRTEVLRESEHNLWSAQKIESIGGLAGGIAHGFNNQLMCVMGYTELAMLDEKLSKKTRDHLQQIAIISAQARDMVKQLLAFSRRQLIDPVLLSSNAIARNVNDIVRNIFPENIQLNIRYCPSEVTIKADPIQIQQILINIFINARDVMPHGGSIFFSIEKHRIDRAFVVRFPFSKEGKYLLLKIRDSGPGMSKEIQDRIFEPFFTTKPVGQGNGLGMAVVYGIVKQHRGYITLNNELRTGTEFQIYLPIFEENTDTSVVSPSQTVSREEKSGKLLLVETSGDDSISLQKM